MSFLSRLFGKEDDVSRELREAMKTIWRIIDDEEFQNSFLPELIAGMVKSGAAVDRLPNCVGAYGLEATNPIPVNGAIGELAYLSRLETPHGERLLFHRIGAINMIDVFEAVTYSGGAWFVFFVDVYHPRRSRVAPIGLRIATEPRQFSGFHNHCPNFPYDFAEAKQATADILRLAYIPLGNVMPQIEKKAFTRPMAHKAKLDIVTSMMTSRMDV
jgi:hypothetical protein